MSGVAGWSHSIFVAPCALNVAMGQKPVLTGLGNWVVKHCYALRLLFSRGLVGRPILSILKKTAYGRVAISDENCGGCHGRGLRLGAER